MEHKIIRKHMTFTGRVQGVGFRYRAKYAADSLGLTGWVRNEWDGSVEMEVQGIESLINKMLVLVNQSSYIIIDRIITTEIPVKKEEKGFHTR